MTEKKEINDFLESIIFDEGQLRRLKTDIEHVRTGELTPKEFKKTILYLRSDLVERLFEFFKFKLDLSIRKTTLKNNIKISSKDENSVSGSTHSENSQIIRELEEKNRILGNIGAKMNTIYKKLTKTD